MIKADGHLNGTFGPFMVACHIEVVNGVGVVVPVKEYHYHLRGGNVGSVMLERLPSLVNNSLDGAELTFCNHR